MQRKESFFIAILSLLFASLFVYGTLGLVENEDLVSAEQNDLVVKDNTINKGNATTTIIDSSGDSMKEEKKDPDATRKLDIRILCVGDSLTAGVTRVGNKDWTPYAPFLEAALRNRTALSSHSVTVYHKGYPGWTSADLMYGSNHGSDNLTSILADSLFQDLDLVLLMAGSNDILQGKFSAYNVSEQVIALHQFCYEHFVPRTIALEIPGARNYENSPETAEQVQVLSEHLRRYTDSEGRATFVSFPFEYEDGDNKWSADGV
jgi:lysophospholipase L1-like esterase